MKYAAISCTLSDTYDFFLPICAKVWKEKIGYEPIIFLVGTPYEWEVGHPGVVLGEIRKLQCKVEWVDRVPGVPDPNVAMAVRQHAAALPWLSHDDLLLVGDADMIPIRKSLYHSHDLNETPVVIYHADMYLETYWPAYGLSMSAETWREVMGISVGNLMGSLLKTFADGNIIGLVAAQKADYTDSRLWYFDEQYASLKLRNSRFYEKIKRVLPTKGERICRNSWPNPMYALNYVDCHCPRPGYTDENWLKIRSVIAQAAPETLPWADRYFIAYRNAIGLSLQDPNVQVKAERSTFDSEVFGCNVGILKCSGKIPNKMAIQGANSEFDVIFVKADGWQVPDAAVSALDYCFEMELKSKPVEFNQDIVKCDFARPSHIAIAKTAFPDSRFLRDLRLARKTDALYERWLASASSVYALEPVENDAFMVATEDPDGAGRVSLLAVLDKSRGIGIGEALVNGVISKPSAAGTWRVKVSCRNVGGIRFYEKLGFRVKSVHTAFHVWTSGEEG